MDAKKKLIFKEWIDIVGEEKFKSLLIDENGYLNFTSTKEYHSYNNIYPNKFMVKDYNPYKNGADSHVQNISIRPVTLHKLENNNGWISLKESGLPVDDNYYFVVIDNHISIKQFHIIQYKWWREYVSHYQPITKPKNPLF